MPQAVDLSDFDLEDLATPVEIPDEEPPSSGGLRLSSEDAADPEEEQATPWAASRTVLRTPPRRKPPQGPATVDLSDFELPSPAAAPQPSPAAAARRKDVDLSDFDLSGLDGGSAPQATTPPAAPASLPGSAMNGFDPTQTPQANPSPATGEFLRRKLPETFPTAPEAAAPPVDPNGPEAFAQGGAPVGESLVQGREPTFWEGVKNALRDGSGVSRERLTNALALAETLQVPPSQVVKNWDQYREQAGMHVEPGPGQIAGAAMALPVVAGMMTAPAVTLLGLAAYEGLSEAESYGISKAQGEEYRLGVRKGLADLLPDETGDAGKGGAEIVDFLAKGGILGLAHKGVPKAWEAVQKSQWYRELSVPERSVVATDLAANLDGLLGLDPTSGQYIKKRLAALKTMFGADSPQYRSYYDEVQYGSGRAGQRQEASAGPQATAPRVDLSDFELPAEAATREATQARRPFEVPDLADLEDAPRPQAGTPARPYAPGRLNATAFPGSTKGNRLSDEQLGDFMESAPAGQALGRTLAALRAAGHDALADKVQITSANAGEHVAGSRHYKNLALDINAKGLSADEQATLADFAEKNGLVRDVKGEPWHYSYRGETPPQGAPVPDFIHRAAGRVGEDAGYLSRLMWAESGGDADAKAATSSARGLFQFTDGTWRGMIRQYGREYGLTPDGRGDPDQQATAAALLARDDRAALTQALGRAPNDGELYMAHFMGRAGAGRFLTGMQANPDAPAVQYADIPAVKANRAIFYDTSGQPRTARQVFDLMAGKVAGGGASAAAAAETAGRTATAQPFAMPAAGAEQTVEPAAPGMPEPDAMPAAPSSELDGRAHEAATSPRNDLPEPSEAQKEAGNYRKGHVRIQGLDISVENPAGSTRSGIAPDGTAWETEMAHHYGYIKGTTGRDKDHIDVFLGDKAATSPWVFVVNQTDPATGKFDEHKVMLGFDTPDQAQAAYLANYADGWQGLGSMARMDMAGFKAWLKNGNTRLPARDRKPLRKAEPVADQSARYRSAPEQLGRLSEVREDLPPEKIVHVARQTLPGGKIVHTVMDDTGKVLFTSNKGSLNVSERIRRRGLENASQLVWDVPADWQPSVADIEERLRERRRKFSERTDREQWAQAWRSAAQAEAEADPVVRAVWGRLDAASLENDARQRLQGKFGPALFWSPPKAPPAVLQRYRTGRMSRQEQLETRRKYGADVFRRTSPQPMAVDALEQEIGNNPETAGRVRSEYGSDALVQYLLDKGTTKKQALDNRLAEIEAEKKRLDQEARAAILQARQEAAHEQEADARTGNAIRSEEPSAPGAAAAREAGAVAQAGERGGQDARLAAGRGVFEAGDATDRSIADSYEELRGQGFSDEEALDAYLEWLFPTSERGAPSVRRSPQPEILGEDEESVARDWLAGDVRFARGDAPAGSGSVDAATLRDALEPALRLYPGAARFVHVFENEAGLSLAERRQVAEAGMSGRFYAAYFPITDRIAFVAANIPSIHAAQLAILKLLLRHEGRHKGLDMVFGGEAGRLEWMGRAAAALPREVAAWLRENGKASTPESRVEAAEEILVDWAARGKVHTWVDRLLARIAAWVRSIFPGLRLTRAEMRALLARVDDWLGGKGARFLGEETRPARLERPAPAFSRREEGASGANGYTVADATMPRAAETFRQARQAADAFVGRALANDATGMVATVSNTNVRKMLSESAVRKSVSPRAQAQAVANLDRLFKIAGEPDIHPDRDASPRLKSIRRFYAPMLFDGEVLVAKMTIKEFAEAHEGNKIYSIEAMEIEKAARNREASLPEGQDWRTSPQAAFLEKVRTLERQVKQGGQSEDEDVRFSRMEKPARPVRDMPGEQRIDEPAAGFPKPEVDADAPAVKPEASDRLYGVANGRVRAVAEAGADGVTVHFAEGDSLADGDSRSETFPDADAARRAMEESGLSVMRRRPAKAPSPAGSVSHGSVPPPSRAGAQSLPDAGGPRRPTSETPGATDEPAALRVEMPEMVRLARELLGRYPAVVEKLRGRRVGEFLARGPEARIRLKSDIFVGPQLAEGTFRTPAEADAFIADTLQRHGLEWDAAHVARTATARGEQVRVYRVDPEYAGTVLAHEIGHLVDYLPDHELRRGNILGHIAALKKHFKHWLANRPGGPGPLTPKERRRLLALAKRLSQGRSYEIEVEEEIVRHMGVTPEQILGIWNDVAGKDKVSPELYEYISGLSTAEKKSILREAMRGLVAEELKRFGRTVREKTGRMVRKTVVAESDAAAVKAKFRDLVRREIEARRLFSRDDVKEELKALSRWWSPFDPAADAKYTAYRHGNEELYADAFSALLNSPYETKSRAPGFYEAFFNYLGERPKVKAEYDAIQDAMRSGDYKAERVTRLDRMFRAADEAYRVKYEDRLEIGRPIKTALVNRHAPVFAALTDPRVRFLVEKAVYTGSQREGYLREVFATVTQALEKANLTIENFGEYLFHKRVIGDRSKLANPQGWTAAASRERLEEMRGKSFTPGQAAALEQARRDLLAIRREWVVEEMEKAGMFAPELMKTVAAAEDYATFDVFSHSLEEGYGQGVGAAIHRQIGTVNEIANPFTATVMKDLSMLGALHWNTAKRAVIEDLLAGKPGSIEPAKRVFNGKRLIPVEPKAKNQGMIVYLDGGEVKAFYVDRMVADAFNQETAEEISALGRVLHYVANPFRLVFTQFNPGFQMYNVIKDFRSALVNLPGTNPEIRFLKEYVKAIVPAFQSAFGLPPDTVKTMEKAGMFVSVANPMGVDREDVQMRRLEQMYGLRPKQWEIHVWKPMDTLCNWLAHGALKATNFAMNVSGAFERVPKIAGYTYLKRYYPGLDEHELAHMVRSWAGSPAFLNKGTAHGITNNLILFSNAFVQGNVATLEAMRANPKQYWWKWAKWALAPKLLMFGAAVGLLGTGARLAMDGVGDYDKTNYLVIPLGLTDSGKTTCLRLPLDEFSRLTGGVLWKMLDLARTGEARNLNSLADFMAGQVPSLNPMFGIAWNVWGYLSGHNPYDNFRQKPILDETTFRAGGAAGAKAMAKYVWNTAGGGVVHVFRGDDAIEVRRELFEDVLRAPFLANTLGRFVKVTDQGVREELDRSKEPVRRDRAREVLAVRAALAKLVNGEAPSAEELALLTKERDYVKDMLPGARAKREGATLLDALMRAATKQEKLAVLLKWREMGREVQ